MVLSNHGIENRHDSHDELHEWDVISLGYESTEEASQLENHQAKGMQRRSTAQKLTHSTTELTKSVHHGEYQRAAEIVGAVRADLTTKAASWVPLPGSLNLPGIQMVSNAAKKSFWSKKGTLESRVSTVKYKMVTDEEGLEGYGEEFVEVMRHEGRSRSQEQLRKEEKEIEFLREPLRRKDSGFEQVDLGMDEEKNAQEDSG
jgi:hypothetical protein